MTFYWGGGGEGGGGGDLLSDVLYVQAGKTELIMFVELRCLVGIPRTINIIKWDFIVFSHRLIVCINR